MHSLLRIQLRQNKDIAPKLCIPLNNCPLEKNLRTELGIECGTFWSVYYHVTNETSTGLKNTMRLGMLQLTTGGITFLNTGFFDPVLKMTFPESKVLQLHMGINNLMLIKIT